MKTLTHAPKPTHSSTGPAARARAPFFKKRSLQRSVVTGRPGDTYEREADAVADVVTTRSGARPDGATSPVVGRISPLVQRRAEHVEDQRVQAQMSEREDEPVQAQAEREEERVQAQAEEEEKAPVQAQAEREDEAVQAQAEEEEKAPVQAQAEEEEKEPVQAQAERDEERVQAQAQDDEKEPVQAQAAMEEEPVQAQVEGAVASRESVRERIRASRGRGRPLPETVRGAMEQRFGADFSGIRIHTDDPAIRLTQLLKAHAFTHDSDIYFNQGRFAPGTRDGDHLLAHELTHTVQQGAAGPRDVEPPTEAAAIQRQEDEQATIDIRPELLQAIKIAQGQIGKVNAKKTNADGSRLGWERLYEYFFTAFGKKEVVHQDIIKFIRTVKDEKGQAKDSMPSWCGIFVWWAYKTAGIPIPDWKLGVPILTFVTPRKPGELPRKGDIAYRQEFQHFAMVTGVESPDTAAGKSFKSIKVATINGNTSGDDNLGGQIEEKWEPISRWLGFFDPVAKLDMPEVPLVRTGVEPDQPEEMAAGDAAVAAALPPVEDMPPTDVSGLEEGVATAPDLPDADETDVAVEPSEPAVVEPEPEVELPPAPPMPAEEPVAAVEPLALEGTSEQAMVTFVDASPSQMAATEPALGPALDGKLQQEKQQEIENAPVLVAKTSGKADEGLTPPDQIPVPSDAAIGDGVTGTDPGDLTATPHQNVGETPTNAVADQELDTQEREGGLGGFFGWLRKNFSSFLARIRTRDPGVNTSAGARPNVQLEGESDPNRMREQRQDATAQLVAQRDATTDTFKNHPGQQNIQPVEVEEEKPVELSDKDPVPMEATADQGVADYADAQLPADVRTKADELLQPGLQGNLAPARTETLNAATLRDENKASEIASAESEVAELNEKADKNQRDIVVKNRTEVARQQGEGIAEAYGDVNEFNQSADAEHTAARKEIGTKVKDSEGKARKELDQGEGDAKKEKEKGEKEAAEKKKELDRAKEKQSWWDRAVSAVKSAVKAITKAIDGIFNKIRSAVKSIIDKAKNLAIGLINAARDWVVDKLNKFRNWAKEKVDKYLKDTFPGLARRINSAIDSVVDTAIDGVNYAADTAIAAVEAVAGALAAALDKILSTFQTALKAAVAIAGAILTGDFAEALRIAIQAVCDIAGIDSQPIFDFIDRAAGQILAILKAPKKFFDNVVEAVAGGVRNFAKNIKKHLINGLLGWLTGALSEVAITLPETFDVKGAFSLVMQILGLTYENIKAKVIKKFPPAATVFDVIEKSLAFVTRLVTDGPTALWEEAKASLANLKEIVLSGIRTFVITTVVKEAIVWLLSLLNPAAALVKLLKLIIDFIIFMVERFEQIKDFILSVYNSLSAIASGALDQAKTAVEDALGRSLPVVISLLASLAGLGGIGKTVKGIIAKVSKPVHRVVDRVVDKIVAFAKKVLKKGTAVAAKAKEKVLAVIQWWKESETFKSKDGGSHRVFYEGSGRKAELMVASNKDKVGPFLTKKLAQARDNDQKKAIRKAQRAYDKVLASETRLEQLETRKAAAKSESAKTTINKSIERENGKLRGALVGFSRTLEDVDFAGESDLLVKTQVSPASGSKASVVEANPLTYLPGNTVGTPPKQNPPGWAHAVKIDTDPVTHKRLSLWVRGHLLNENLHGPGESWNLVPISQKVNGEMRDGPEAKAKQAIATKGNVIYYRTSVTFHDGKAPVSDFPKKIHVTWGYLERVPGSAPPTFTRKSGTEKRVPFGPLDLPPATAADIKYNINKIGRPLLVELTGVSVRFGLYVLEEKDRAKDFRSYEDFAARMMKYQKREGKDEAVFNAYLQGIKDAENAGKLVFK